MSIPTQILLLAAAGIVAMIGGAAVAFVLLVRRESRQPRVLCLMYHRLRDSGAGETAKGTERMFVLSVEEFERQIAYLKQSGHRFLSADEACRFARGILTIREPAVLITFDDGCRSSAELGGPVLGRYGARATMFVTTDPRAGVFQLGAGDPRLSDEALQALDGKVMSIGAHGVSHEPLSGMGEEAIRHELVEAKRELERVTGRSVDYFAVPGNWFDRRVLRIAAETGYQAVWCSVPGAIRPGMNPYGLPRVNIDGDMDLARFRAQLQPSGVARRRLLFEIKSAPKRVLGPHRWAPIRAFVLRLVPGGHLSMRRMTVLLAAGLVLLVVVLIAWAVLLR